MMLNDGRSAFQWWDPLPLARAILAEYDPPPYALIAAWKCKHHGDCDQLSDLAVRAAQLPAAAFTTDNRPQRSSPGSDSCPGSYPPEAK